MLTFCKGLSSLFYGTAFFPLTLAVFNVSGRLAETGNQSPLVAFESARVAQVGDMLSRFEAFILWHSFFFPQSQP